MVRVQGERRPSRRTRDGRDRRRRRRADRAGRCRTRIAPWPAAAILGACLAWGLDNNLTRKVALNDASWLAAVKGLVAGPVNLALAFALGARLPAAPNIAAALVLGFAAYGVSLVLFVVGLRHLGTARAGAYFSVAPFVGAVLALALGDPLTPALVIGGAFMGVGVWLHLTEHHAHEHTHPAITHEHWHTNDEDHRHEHDQPVPARAGHSHVHYPDSNHRHPHDPEPGPRRP